MGMNDLIPRDDFELLLSRWWLLAILIITGGLIGWIVSRSHPPIYEARASLVVNPNYSQLKGMNGNNSSLDTSNIVALVSPKALGPTLIQGLDTHGVQIKIQNMQIEQRESVWDLVVRSTDAQVSADMANAWIDLAYTTVEQASEHYLNLMVYTDEFNLLTSCKVDSTSEICTGISTSNPLIQQLQSLQEKMSVEKKASQGINTDISIRIESHADVPTKPATFAPGLLILAGAFVGLLLGILMVMVYPRNPFGKIT